VSAIKIYPGRFVWQYKRQIRWCSTIEPLVQSNTEQDNQPYAQKI